ncbi:MAG TPA: helix-turn-helix domain-containing protein [Rhodothermales bacterium]|nr:helix-turn-helix domain-containing protein [Rhodothermales bacterium]
MHHGTNHLHSVVSNNDVSINHRILLYVNALPFPEMLPYDVESLLTMLHTRLFDETTLVIHECLCACRDHSHSLQYRFAHFLGKTPHKYVQHHRLTLAEMLLRETDEMIAEIALSVGYKTHCAFNMAFTRRFGMPPDAYRKKCIASCVEMPQNTDEF